MRYADLHTHTHHSDGTRSPKEVIDVAREHRLDIVAISDHDNLAAYYEIKAYADEQSITLVPAIELSCGVQGVDVHILAYAFDPHDARIDSRLRDFRELRQRRGYEMVERLCALGYPITAERVDQLAAGGAVGRPHVARALVEAGHASSVSDAFDRLIGSGGPAYVEKGRFDLEEAVAMIKAAGGLTSVAHPSIYPNHETLVPQVLEAGVDGIEVFHPDVNEPNRERYANLARFRGLMTTGGSDDHGTVKKKQTLGSIRVPENLIQPILDRL
jgi:predicted metal-dependent phosphoesterase TrpH